MSHTKFGALLLSALVLASTSAFAASAHSQVHVSRSATEHLSAQHTHKHPTAKQQHHGHAHSQYSSPKPAAQR